MAIDQAYVGQELTIFAHATHWKQYYTSILRPYIGKHVVEVGAGTRRHHQSDVRWAAGGVDLLGTKTSH